MPTPVVRGSCCGHPINSHVIAGCSEDGDASVHNGAQMVAGRCGCRWSANEVAYDALYGDLSTPKLPRPFEKDWS